MIRETEVFRAKILNSSPFRQPLAFQTFGSMTAAIQTRYDKLIFDDLTIGTHDVFGSDDLPALRENFQS